jgi:hypothetical protein
MHWTDIDLAPTPRKLRQFSGLWLVFFGGFAVYEALDSKPTAAGVLAAIALGVGTVGLVKPSAVRFVYLALTVLTFPLGWVVSRVLLAVLYYGLFTPLGLLFRLLGRDGLTLRRRPDAESYWERKPIPSNPGSYLRQY